MYHANGDVVKKNVIAELWNSLAVRNYQSAAEWVNARFINGTKGLQMLRGTPNIQSTGPACGYNTPVFKYVESAKRCEIHTGHISPTGLPTKKASIWTWDRNTMGFLSPVKNLSLTAERCAYYSVFQSTRLFGCNGTPSDHYSLRLAILK
jgi:hypothetical protein